jgi:hypothetical protein
MIGNRAISDRFKMLPELLWYRLTLEQLTPNPIVALIYPVVCALYELYIRDTQFISELPYELLRR